ncbi:MAG: TetR/AcrR family transcriptional regulator [bacterium]|nr:TetR/AcrR family transcriptional regulator [bacterium]
MTSIALDNIELSGKQREILERDERFLDLARQIFLDEGFHAVTVGRIARITGFSKGTLYQRFAGKEELMVELALRCRRQLVDMMQQVSQIEGRPRERMVAIGEGIERYSRLSADNMRIMSVIDEQTVRDRVPVEQLDHLKQLGLEFFEVLAGIVRDAVDCGDLVLPKGMTAASMSFSLWALVDGWAHAARGAAPLEELGMHDSVQDILRSAQYLMDGYGWQPLYHEWDYSKVTKRVAQILPVEGESEA